MPCKRSYPDIKREGGIDIGLTSDVILLNQVVPPTPIRKARKGAAPIDAALLQTRCTRCGEVFPTVLRRMRPDSDTVRNVPQCGECRHRYPSCHKSTEAR